MESTMCQAADRPHSHRLQGYGISGLRSSKTSGREAMQPHITVIRAEGARYKMSFESDDGTITGKINVALPEGGDKRPTYQKRQAAVEKMKILAAAICREIEKREKDPAASARG